MAGPSSCNEMASTSANDANNTSLHPFVTQKLVDTGKYYCPFLERGFCRESARCNFSHDSQESTKIPTEFCHFYLANKCLYGQECKFIHGEPVIEDLNEDVLDIENMTITDSNHNDDDYGDNHFTEYNNYNQSRHCYSEMVNTSTLDDQVPKNNDLSRHGASNYNDDQASSPKLHDTLPANMTRMAKITVSSLLSSSISSPYSHDTIRQTNGGGHSSSAASSSGLSAHGQSSHRLKTGVLLRGPISSEVDCPKSKETEDKGASSSATRAWQGGRLLARLKGVGGSSSQQDKQAQLKDLPLCPYAVASGGCPYPEGACSYLHGQVCDLCCVPCLHPFDDLQRRQHRDDCLREHEREMELSFAVQRSRDKICGICMETVVEKKPITSSRFGILEKCNHIFCLDCIRKWRGTKQFDSKTIRACPECRVNSDFVVPSKYWIEDQDDKEKLIRDYKSALKSKPCRYFNEGMGECPFAGSCFYKHAYPDGRIAEMEAPKPKRRVYGSRGATSLTNYVLWSLIRSFDDDDWSNDDESESRYYIDYDDEVDDEDEEEDANERALRMS